MSDAKTALQTGQASLNTDWEQVAHAIAQRGWAVLDQVLPPPACRRVIDLYGDAALFRKRVVMAQHGFGRGEYQYFSYPLPPLVQELRERLYGPLSRIANGWKAALKDDARFPPSLGPFLQQCHAAGQKRPTPLLLRYEAGDYNCLHQDLYGPHVFPLQVAFLLSRPAEDFTGGEFVLTEQRPRMQSRAHVVPLRQGDAVIFATSERPVQGARGFYRVKMRHGVSALHSGDRYTLGIIFHDAT